MSAATDNLVPALATTAALWVGWRLWRFTISPALYPNAPKSPPYPVPFFGHVKAMSTNAGKLFTFGREYFGNTREIFSVSVMGQELYIVTSATDVLAVYKESEKLDFDSIVKDIMG